MRLRVPGALLTVLLVAACAVTALAADSAEEAIKKDRKLYQGTWQVVSLEVDGNKAPEADAKKIKVINESDGKWAIEVDGVVVGRGTSRIDPAKKPKTIDLTGTEGEGKGKTSLGIYELKKDRRKVCFAQADRERPTEFASTAGSGHILVILERVKK
jgi:uncharacterized protein (TIGR03067 family)